MIFDKEQWPILADPAGPQSYAGLSNLCSVNPVKAVRKAKSAYIRVPAEVFHFLEVFLHVGVDDIGRVGFYLDEVSGGGPWVFGIYMPNKHGTRAFFDMWTYSKRPRWSYDNCT